MMNERRILAIRALAALAGSAAVVALVEAAGAQSWPATAPAVFLPLLLVAAGVPLLLVFGAGHIPARPLTAWASAGAVVLAGLGWADMARRAPVQDGSELLPSGLLPSGPLAFTLVASFFVAQVLVTDIAGTRRLLPPYPRHFDTGWKQGVQAAVSVVFALLFWGVLGLGAGLFQLLGLGLPGQVLRQPPFIIPALALAFAAAIHVMDVQPALLRGVRSLLLGLLAFLLPVLAGLVLAFLLTLAVTTVAPLWDTHVASVLLGGTGWALVLLANSAYGDGDGWTKGRVRRAAVVLAALELPLLAGLAALALAARVAQYGWTAGRVFGAVAAGLLAVYAAGYFLAVVLRRPRILEITNFASAWLALALVLLLFTPVADPARLVTNSQVARLRAGAVAPGAFDFPLLRRDGARWGAAALDGLAGDADPAVAQLARAELSDRNRPEVGDNGAVLDPALLAGRVTVLPKGRPFPAAILRADFAPGGDNPPYCFRPGYATCTLRFVALKEGAPEAVLLLDGTTAQVFDQDASGRWRNTGTLSGPVACDVVQRALKEGRFGVVANTGPGLVAAGVPLPFGPPSDGCPADPKP